MDGQVELGLLLVVSVVFNLITLRWALSENASRRRWQQEVDDLQRMVHIMVDSPRRNGAAARQALAALVFLLSGVFLAVLLSAWYSVR